MADTTFPGALKVEGNVGIGADPLSNIQLYAVSSTSLGQILIENSDGTLFKLAADGSRACLGTDSAFPIDIMTDNEPRISITDTGNVGIGTTGTVGPGSKLEINGDLKLQHGVPVNEFSNDSDLNNNSDLAVPTEKAVKTYVDGEISPVNTALAAKAEKTYVDGEIGQVNTALAAKAEKTYVDDEIGQVNTALTAKAEKTYVDDEIGQVNTALAAKAEKTYVDDEIGQVNTALAAKAEKTYVDDEIGQVNTALAAKAEKTYVDDEIGQVNTALAAKAEKTYVDNKIDQVNATKAELNGSDTQDFKAKTLTIQDTLKANKVQGTGGGALAGLVTFQSNLKVLGNFEVDGETTFRNIEQHQGDIELGNEDTDEVRIHGVLRSTHSSRALKISSAVDIGSAATPANLQVNGSVTATTFQGNGENLSGLVKKAGDTLTGPLTIDDSLTVSGKVGIGTTTPADKLDVNGALRFNGNPNRRVYGASRAGSDTVVLDGRWNELEVKGRVIDWTGSSLHIGYQNDHSDHHVLFGNGKLKSVQIQGKTDLVVGGNLTVKGAVASNLTIKNRRLNIHSNQARFEGVHNETRRAQLVLSSEYSDLVIASSQVNNNHGSTLTFATYNPSDATQYEKWVVNQGNWGTRKSFLDFGFSNVGGRTNPHSNINSRDTVLTLNGVNKRVGIGTHEPNATLHVNGSLKLNIGEGLEFLGENDYFGSYQDARIFRMIDINGHSGDVDGGIAIEGFTPTDQKRKPIMAIRGSGKVGIGANSPRAKLHVNGSLKISSTFFVEGHPLGYENYLIGLVGSSYSSYPGPITALNIDDRSMNMDNQPGINTVVLNPQGTFKAKRSHNILGEPSQWNGWAEWVDATAEPDDLVAVASFGGVSNAPRGGSAEQLLNAVKAKEAFQAVKNNAQSPYVLLFIKGQAKSLEISMPYMPPNPRNPWLGTQIASLNTSYYGLLNALYGRVGIGTTNPQASLEVKSIDSKIIPVIAQSSSETVAKFSRSSGDASVLLETGSSSEVYLRFKNKETESNAWMTGMDDDEQFRICYGGDGEMSSSKAKLEILKNGNVNARGRFGSISDIRVKKEVHPIEDALAKVLTMRGVTYQWRDENTSEAIENRQNIGLIAQEVEKILPEVVQTGVDGYKSICYGDLASLLIEAIKEQQTQLTSLITKVKMLEAQ